MIAVLVAVVVGLFIFVLGVAHVAGGESVWFWGCVLGAIIILGGFFYASYLDHYR